MMNHRVQNTFVLVLFVGIVLLIAYPLLNTGTGNQELLATPAQEMHLTVDDAGKEAEQKAQENQIAHPILQKQ